MEIVSDIIVGPSKTTKKRKLFETEDELKLQRWNNRARTATSKSKIAT